VIENVGIETEIEIAIVTVRGIVIVIGTEIMEIAGAAEVRRGVEVAREIDAHEIENVIGMIVNVVIMLLCESMRKKSRFHRHPKNKFFSHNQQLHCCRTSRK
jgi:hypothetical protein